MKSLLTIFLALTPFSSALAVPPNKAAEELDIREATFRYQIGQDASDQQRSTKHYYLSIQAGEEPKGPRAIQAGKKELDPDDAFMKRFALDPRVKKSLQCYATTRKGVEDKKTGEPAVVFSTGAIRWVSQAEVEIHGEYCEGSHAGTLTSSGATYHLTKYKGKWRVIGDTANWVSYVSAKRVDVFGPYSARLSPTDIQQIEFIVSRRSDVQKPIRSIEARQADEVEVYSGTQIDYHLGHNVHVRRSGGRWLIKSVEEVEIVF
jgi:hypothetical protein